MSKIDYVCIIDDDSFFQFFAQRVITETKLVDKIKIFSNGLEAISFLQSVAKTNTEELPDIIFLDLSMPIMDGWGFLEEYIPLKSSLKKKITLYIVSSSIDPSDRERARTISEVTNFIIKPVTREKFIEIIENI